MPAIDKSTPRPITDEMIAEQDDRLAEQLARLGEAVARSVVVRDALVAALRPFANLGVGSGPGELSETYKIERNAIRAARAALALIGDDK
jgi:hypothetical protein